jgi:hypothetical protein
VVAKGVPTTYQISCNEPKLMRNSKGAILLKNHAWNKGIVCIGHQDLIMHNDYYHKKGHQINDYPIMEDFIKQGFVNHVTCLFHPIHNIRILLQRPLYKKISMTLCTI